MHLDFVVDGLEKAIERAEKAGAKTGRPARNRLPGAIWPR